MLKVRFASTQAIIKHENASNSDTDHDYWIIMIEMADRANKKKWLLISDLQADENGRDSLRWIVPSVISDKELEIRLEL